MNLLILVAAAAVIAVIGYGWYATIVTRKNRMDQALSGIDIQLKKRHDLIPNLLTVLQKTMDFEERVLTEITRLRKQAVKLEGVRSPDALEQKFQVESALQRELAGFNLQVEAYPDIAADETARQTMRAWEEVEDNVAASRRFYNSAVVSLRNAVQIFPGNMINALVGAVPLPLFETDAAEREPISAADYLR